MTDRRPGPPSEFFRRLRARSLSSWGVGERAAAAREAMRTLAALGWPGPGPVPAVPDLGPHAIADQLQVLADAAVAAGAPSADVDAVIVALADRLSIRVD